MRDINIGLIGFGYAGQTFHAPLIQATEGLRLAAVASSQPDKVGALLGPSMRVGTVQSLIDDLELDVIVIAAPNAAHHGLTKAALAAGHHVVVDKPFTLDLAQAQELEGIATAQSRILSVFHNRRWDSDFLLAQSVLKEGHIGEPVEFISNFDRYRPVVRERWREGGEAGAGLWMDLGPHLIDQAVQLFGCPTDIRLELAKFREGAKSDDWFDARLRWKQGGRVVIQASLRASCLAAIPGPRFTLHGVQGSFEVHGLDPQEDALKAGLRPTPRDVHDWGKDPRRARMTVMQGNSTGSLLLDLPNGSYPTYYRQLRDAVWGLVPNPVPVEEALIVQALLDAGRLSSISGRSIPVLMGSV